MREKKRETSERREGEQVVEIVVALGGISSKMNIKKQLKTANCKLQTDTEMCFVCHLFSLALRQRQRTHHFSCSRSGSGLCCSPLATRLAIVHRFVCVRFVHSSVCVCVCLGHVPADGSQKWKCMINDTRFCFLFATHFLCPLSPFYPLPPR